MTFNAVTINPTNVGLTFNAQLIFLISKTFAIMTNFLNLYSQALQSLVFPFMR
jgi:hypothetical protein